MSRTIVITLCLSLALACGGGEATPAPTPAEPAVTPPPPPEPVPSVPPAPEALPDDTIPNATFSDLILNASSITSARGGPPVTIILRSMVCHDAPMARGGDGFGSECTWTAEHCHGTLRIESRIIPAASMTSLTLHAEPETPDDAAVCARFEGDFTRSTISDPQAGGPPPDPSFPGAECLMRAQLRTADRATCATLWPTVRGEMTLSVTTYVGACCVGTETAHLTVPPGPETLLADAQTVVVLIHDRMISREEVALDPTLAVVARASGNTELHLSELFAGDPLLTGGTGFGYTVRLDGTTLVVAAVGGPEHRHAL